MLFYILLSFAVAYNCVRTTTFRGFPPRECNHGSIANSCYSECKKGYVAVGPVCWEECSTLGKRLGKDNCSNGGALCYCPPFDFPLKKYYAREIAEKDCDSDEIKLEGLCFRPCSSYWHHKGKIQYKVDSIKGNTMTCKAEWISKDETGGCWYD